MSWRSTTAKSVVLNLKWKTAKSRSARSAEQKERTSRKSKSNFSHGTAGEAETLTPAVLFITVFPSDAHAHRPEDPKTVNS